MSHVRIYFGWRTSTSYSMGVSHSVYGTQWQLEGLLVTLTGAVSIALALQHALSMKMGLYYARPLAYLISTFISVVLSGIIFGWVQRKRRPAKPARGYTGGLDHSLGIASALVCMFISFLVSLIPNVGDWSLLIGPIGFVILIAMIPRVPKT